MAPSKLFPRGLPQLHFAGNRALCDLPWVAVVGSRQASELGILRAKRLARELARAGVVVVSGLARGIDEAAHEAAMAAFGETVAVIGTPLERAYPAEHADLQARIAAKHLVLSPFAAGTPTTRACFPTRNRVMAALCQATVIVEATDRSGTLYQADACRRLGRDLFICASQMSRSDVLWHQRFSGPRTHVLTHTDQVLEVLCASGSNTRALLAGNLHAG